ncbi:MAG: Unknown protein [uncultured Sulfurovum sp.]|uniref:Peptidase M50 domain-containing protein n=1 Tax=uncultured Sulfurovum sp. TaxID=269237 RepID=A0A6S6S247_9BACT|nr:MAG: Unknown protein [uncultured Sulfurovum sp.]
MFTLENILLIIIVGLILFNIQTILSAIILFFENMQEVVVESIEDGEIPSETEEIIKPYKDFLESQGFTYLYAYQYNNMLEKNNTPQHTLYFYNEEEHIHAFLDTTPIKGCLQALTINYTTIYENFQVVATYDCFAHNLKVADSVTLFDHYHGSFEKALMSHREDRLSLNEPIQTEVFSQEGCLNYSQYQIDETFRLMIEENIMHPTANGYKFSLSIPFFKYVQNSIKGYKRAAKVLMLKQYIKQEKATSQPKQQLFYQNSEMQALAQQLNEKPTEKTREQKIQTFLISGLGFVLVFGLLGIPWATLPLLIVILIVHELGHYFAMRYFGYQDTSIFFIPFFGAAAKGDKEHVTPFEEYIVSLAGPLPGIIIGVGIFMYVGGSTELKEISWVQQYALFSIILNYLNLLPIYPLDGGKIVQSLLFTRYPKAQFYFFLLSFVVIILAAIMLRSPLIGLFGVFLFFAINHNYKTSILIQEIMKEASEAPLKERILAKLSSGKMYEDMDLAKKSAMAKQALKILRTQKPTYLLMVVGIGFYVLLLLLPFMSSFIV